MSSRKVAFFKNNSDIFFKLFFHVLNVIVQSLIFCNGFSKIWLVKHAQPSRNGVIKTLIRRLLINFLKRVNFLFKKKICFDRKLKERKCSFLYFVFLYFEQFDQWSFTKSKGLKPLSQFLMFSASMLWNRVLALYVFSADLF